MAGIRQRELKKRYDEGDPTIDKCDCGNHYRNEKEIGPGVFKLFEECLKCRNLSGVVDFKYVDQEGNELCKKDIEHFLMRPRDRNYQDRKRIKKGVSVTNGELKTNQDLKNECTLNIGVSMKTIRKNIMKEENNGQEITENVKENMPATIMQKTEIVNSEKSLSEDTKIIPQLDSMSLQERLPVESVNSITQLNDITQHLLGFAKMTARSRRAMDDNEVLMQVDIERLQDASKILDMARNAIKTKLEVVKFAKDLSK